MFSTSYLHGHPGDWLYNIFIFQQIHERGLSSTEDVVKHQTFTMNKPFIRICKDNKEGVDVAFGPGLGKVCTYIIIGYIYR